MHCKRVSLQVLISSQKNKKTKKKNSSTINFPAHFGNECVWQATVGDQSIVQSDKRVVLYVENYIQ